jgi:hypothetical protein
MSDKQHRGQLKSVMLFGILGGISFVGITEAITPKHLLDWFIASINVLYATIGGTYAGKQYKRGPRWRKLAIMNTVLFFAGMSAAVWALLD